MFAVQAGAQSVSRPPTPEGFVVVFSVGDVGNVRLYSTKGKSFDQGPPFRSDQPSFSNGPVTSERGRYPQNSRMTKSPPCRRRQRPPTEAASPIFLSVG
jgi:hypothetical protein